MGTQFESKETRVLKTIDSKRYPDTNKDFEKNVRRLNSSVDYMAGYMRVMQKGIDDANKNFIEQIQSFINDMVVLFAGGEPTGFEIGDLKYIIQALGALFGFGDHANFDPVAAVGHFFSGFLAHVIQLTDLIFDSIEAWMNDLADRLDGVPLLGNIAENLANFFNDAHTWADNALESAADAFDHAQDIVDTIIEAFTGSISVGGAISDILENIRDLFLSLFGFDTPQAVLAVGAVPTGMPQDRITGLPAALTYYAGSLQTGSNLLPDPRFENGAIWTNAWTTISTSFAKSGTHSCRIASAGATPRYFYLSPDENGSPQQYQVSSGDTYYFETWVYQPTGNTAGGNVYVQLHVEDSTGGNAIQYVTPCSMTMSVKGTWLQMTGTYKVPVGYDLITPLFLVGTNTTSGNLYYVDNCLMREETLIQLLIDNLVNVFTGGSTTGSLVGAVVAQIQSFFGNLFGQNTPSTKLIPGAIPRTVLKAGVNSCLSPDFEDSGVNRTLTGAGVTGAYSTTQKYSGTQSYALTVGATTTNRGVYLSPYSDTVSEADFTTDIPVNNTQSYLLETWVYAPVGNSSNSAINIVAKVYDDSGNSSTTTVATVTPTKGTWTQLSGMYQIPNNNRYKHMYVSVQYASSTTGDIYYIDNATIRHETFAQAVIDGFHQAVNGGSTVGNATTTVKSNLQTLNNNLWGTNTTGTTVRTAAIPNITRGMSTDLQSTIDNVDQAVNGGSGTNNAASTVKTNLQAIFSNLFGQNTLGTKLKELTIPKSVIRAGVNSCLSPDFEDSAVPRTLTGGGCTGGYSTAQKYTGSQSYEITVGATTSNRGLYLSPFADTVSEADFTTSIPVDISQVYFFQAWIYSPVANTNNPAINLVATVYDDAAHSSTTTVATVTPTKGTWTLLSGMYYVPNAQKYNHMYVSVQYGTGASNGDKHYVDNVILRHETFAQTIVDGLHQAVNGGSTTGSATSTIKTNIQTLNNNLFGTNSTGTVVRTAAIPNITRGMSTDLQSTIDNVHQAVNGGSTTNNAASTVKTNIQSIFSNLFGTTTLGTTLQAAAVPDVTLSMSSALQTTLDNFVAGFGGLAANPDPATLADANDAALAASDAIAANAAAITALQASNNNSVNGGNSAVVDFTQRATASTIAIATTANPGGDFDVTYSGSNTTSAFEIINGSAGWDANGYSGSNTRTAVCIYKEVITLTDYQRIGVVLGSSPYWDKNNNHGGGLYAYDYIYGRSNAAGTERVFVELAGNTIKLGAIVGGTTYNWATYSLGAAGGNAYYLECGTAGGLNQYRVYKNGVLIINFTDSSNNFSSYTNSTHRYTGVGVRGTNATIKPGSMLAFAFSDNTPQTKIGSGFRGYNTSGTGVNLSSGDNLFPNNYFSNDYITADLTSAPGTNNKLTVSQTGWYMVTICSLVDNPGGWNRVKPTVYVNGTLTQYGFGNVGAFATQNESFGGTFIVYLAAGDYIQPGYSAQTAYSGALVGETSGKKTYWSVSLINRSLN